MGQTFSMIGNYVGKMFGGAIGGMMTGWTAGPIGAILGAAAGFVIGAVDGSLDMFESQGHKVDQGAKNFFSEAYDYVGISKPEDAASVASFALGLVPGPGKVVAKGAAAATKGVSFGIKAGASGAKLGGAAAKATQAGVKTGGALTKFATHGKQAADLLNKVIKGVKAGETLRGAVSGIQEMVPIRRPIEEGKAQSLHNQVSGMSGIDPKTAYVHGDYDVRKGIMQHGGRGSTHFYTAQTMANVGAFPISRYMHQQASMSGTISASSF